MGKVTAPTTTKSIRETGLRETAAGRLCVSLVHSGCPLHTSLQLPGCTAPALETNPV